MAALATTSRSWVYSPASNDATPRTSKGPSSFFRLHVRVPVAGPPANGTVIDPPTPSARCALTSENVTWRAVAYSNGVSVIITRRFPDWDGAVGDPLQASAALDKPTARVKALKEGRMRVPSSSHSRRKP